MTVKQEYNAARESIILHRDRLANCGQEATAVYLHTLLAQLDEHFDQYECYEGIGEIEEMKYRAGQIANIYKEICK